MRKILLFACLLVVLASCKKEEKLQPSWWDKLWHKEMVIMKPLDDKNTNVILPAIDRLRTSQKPYEMWGQDTIQINGPGGYKAISIKSFKEWLISFQKTLIADTNNYVSKGLLFEIKQSYLDLRRDYDKDKALKKLWLCIPKDLYEQDERLWEWFLSEVGEYLTVILGGPGEWTDGTIQHQVEMKIYHLPTTPDPKDPWGCECSGEIRITDWFFNYAVGPEDKAMIWKSLDQKTKIQITNKITREKNENYERVMTVFKRTQAEKRFQAFKNLKDENFNVTVEDLETRLTTIAGSEYYVLQLPAVPTR